MTPDEELAALGLTRDDLPLSCDAYTQLKESGLLEVYPQAGGVIRKSVWDYEANVLAHENDPDE